MRAAVRFLAVSAVLVVAPVQSATRVVDDDRRQCPSAAYTTIQAAVNAAAPNDIVRVCAGTYPERVHVPSRVHLHGPKRGVDGRTRAFGGAGEAVIRSPTPLLLRADGIVVDGFSIVVALDDEGEGQGISARGSGFRILNNLFEDDLVSGILPQAVGSATTVIARNQFRGRLGVAADGEHFATAMIIRDNLFRNASVLMINQPHRDIAILRNTFVYSATAPTACTALPHFRCRPGIILDSTVNVQVLSNRISGADEAAIDATATTGLTVQDNTLRAGIGDAIVLRSDHTGLQVLGNRIAGFPGAGVRLDQASGALVEGNEIEDSGDGVIVSGGHTNRIAANNIEDNAAVGIDVETSADNTVQDNEVRGNGVLDCRDTTSGAGSFGTANTWSGNQGSRSSPAGLCPDS